jgi:LmbE family N-acetylglucosaminyl deacetylase
MPTAFAIGAHPDDIEFFMSGTLLLLRQAGYETHYMNIANGCLGTAQHDRETITRIRRAESIAAARFAGAVHHEALCDDLSIYYEPKPLARLTSVIREVAPRIVLTHPPIDYMEDHTNTCRLVVSAAFCRGMPNYPGDPPQEPVEGNVTVYHSQPAGNRDPLRNVVRPDLFVDITAVMPERTEMLAKHESQKAWLDESQGMNSYLVAMREMAREVGAMSGNFEYAEGWRRHLHFGFCGPDDDPLRDALSDRVLGTD